jgi:hypothetical protein
VGYAIETAVFDAEQHHWAVFDNSLGPGQGCCTPQGRSPMGGVKGSGKVASTPTPGDMIRDSLANNVAPTDRPKPRRPAGEALGDISREPQGGEPVGSHPVDFFVQVGRKSA